jgi:peptidoglycan/xylan/chitin deacetylase (PgdA/CDA1 family)
MSAMRLDRSLTLMVARPLCWTAPTDRCALLPILMYHSISEYAETGVGPYYRVATNPRRFAEQMQWLHDAGCKGVSLKEGMKLLGKNEPGGRRPVAITFDDGFRDFHTAAWPALKKYGFTATMYLPTAFICSQRKSFQGKECLTWNEVRELRKYGIRFGSHTVNHPKLYDLSWNEIESELRVSKKRIEEELREQIASFAHPYAFPQEDAGYTKTLREILARCGYRSCVTTIIGRAQPGDDALQLPRLPANACDDRALFLAKLDGAYDWLAPLQRVIRRLKNRRNRPARAPLMIENRIKSGVSYG